MASFWALERSNFSGRGSGMPIAVLLIFLPEVILGMSCNLNTTMGGRVFTILSSVVTGWILHKLFYHYFMIRTYAPITYYVENSYWHGIWKVLFWSAVALMFLLILRIVE